MPWPPSRGPHGGRGGVDAVNSSARVASMLRLVSLYFVLIWGSDASAR